MTGPALDALHARYRQQAGWTAQLRAHLLARAGVTRASRVLEAGCGTGAVLPSLAASAQTTVGLDLDRGSLRFARSRTPALLCQGDAHRLPFAEGAFQAVTCHFLLLWLADPQAALGEMARVTQPGGVVIAFAEPDYRARIDYPPALERLGQQQAEALRSQGADPGIGRQLAALFRTAGLVAVETGLLGGQWRSAPDPADWAQEWLVLERDLAGSVSPEQLAAWKSEDQAAWQAGTRILFVPTFFALGWKR